MTRKMDPDELMMVALDAGAEDFAEEEDSYEIITAPEDFSAVREALEAQEIPMMEAGVTMIPQTWVELTDEEDIKKLNKTLDLLDGDDDVQAVYRNWDEQYPAIGTYTEGMTEGPVMWLNQPHPVLFMF